MESEPTGYQVFFGQPLEDKKDMMALMAKYGVKNMVFISSPEKTTYSSAIFISMALVKSQSIISDCLETFSLEVTIQEISVEEYEKIRDSKRTKLYVGNLPHPMDNATVHSIFSAYGQIDYCHIVKKPCRNGQKGFAYVIFTEKESVDRALADRIKHNKTKLNCKPFVNKCKLKKRQQGKAEEETKEPRIQDPSSSKTTASNCPQHQSSTSLSKCPVQHGAAPTNFNSQALESPTQTSQSKLQSFFSLFSSQLSNSDSEDSQPLGRRDNPFRDLGCPFLSSLGDSRKRSTSDTSPSPERDLALKLIQECQDVGSSDEELLTDSNAPSVTYYEDDPMMFTEFGGLTKSQVSHHIKSNLKQLSNPESKLSLSIGGKKSSSSYQRSGFEGKAPQTFQGPLFYPIRKSVIDQTSDVTGRTTHHCCPIAHK